MKQEPVAILHRFPSRGLLTIDYTDEITEVPEGIHNLYTYPPLATQDSDARMLDLLKRCENEMRYAGWDKFESDNTARNGVYEQVKHYLEKTQ